MITFGGFVSTAFVGLLLKAGSNYGSVVAESYARNLEERGAATGDNALMDEMPPEWRALFEDDELWDELAQVPDLDNQDLVKRVEKRRLQIFDDYNKKQVVEEAMQTEQINGKAPLEPMVPVGGGAEGNESDGKEEVDIFSDYES